MNEDFGVNTEDISLSSLLSSLLVCTFAQNMEIWLHYCYFGVTYLLSKIIDVTYDVKDRLNYMKSNSKRNLAI